MRRDAEGNSPRICLPSDRRQLALLVAAVQTLNHGRPAVEKIDIDRGFGC